MYACLSKLILVYNVTVIHVSIVHMYTYSTCVHVYTVYIPVYMCTQYTYMFVARLRGRSKALPGQYISCIRVLCHVTTGNYRVAICGKGADRVQLDSKYTSKGNSWGTGQLYHDSQGC